MSDTPASPASDERAVRNLRITFWGVQGSCPIFPTPDDIGAFARRVARYTLERALADMAARLEAGPCTPQILRELAQPQRLDEYQQKLGLPELPSYGGDTTCIEVQTGDNHTLVFDMGTGLRDFSRRALSSWPADRPRLIHVFASHEHLDHRLGLPYAGFCFERRSPFTIHVYGTRQFLSALDERYGFYSHRPTPAMHVDDPLDYRLIAATFTGTELCDDVASRGASAPWQVRDMSEPIVIGKTTVTAFEVYHGSTQCLAYQVRHGSATFVFCTDHELRRGDDVADPRQQRSLDAERRLEGHCRGADVAYFDGQYLLGEYMGRQGISSGPAISRLDWGHSCIEDVVERAQRCRIKRSFIGHHDPERHWTDRLRIDRDLHAMCEGKPYAVELAKAGEVIDL